MVEPCACATSTRAVVSMTIDAARTAKARRAQRRRVTLSGGMTYEDNGASSIRGLAPRPGGDDERGTRCAEAPYFRGTGGSLSGSLRLAWFNKTVNSLTFIQSAQPS